MVGKKNNLQPMWKRWMKQVDLEKRTQSLDQVFLGCTQRECKPYKKLVDEHKNLFGSLTSAGTVGKLPRSGESNARITAWSDENGRPCEEMRRKILRIKKSIEQLFGVSTPCVDNHQLGEEESESVEESSNVCSCIVLKCLYLGRIGRLDILLSANHLARAATE